MANEKADLNLLNGPAPEKAKAQKPAVGVPAAAPAVPVVTGDEHYCVAYYWAVIDNDGTLLRGHNVWRARKLATGIYEVIFTGDLSAGVFQATIGRPGIFTEPPGEITTALRFLPPPPNPEFNKGIWIQTFDSAGKPSDRRFHVLAMTAG